MFIVLVMYAISAGTLLLGKQLVLYGSPLFITGIRTLCAGILFLAYAWRAGASWAVTKKLLWPCANIAVYAFFLSNTFKLWALHYSSVSHMAVLSLFEPLLVAVMAWGMFNERISRSKLIGIALCISSGAIMVYQSFGSAITEFQLISLASICACIALASSVYGCLLMRKLIRYHNAPISLVMGLSMTCAGILSLLATSTEAVSCTVNTATLLPFLGSLALMIIMSSGIGYVFYGMAVKRYSAVFIACGGFIRTVLVLLYQRVVGNEALAWELIACILLLGIGLALLYKEENVQPRGITL